MSKTKLETEILLTLAKFYANNVEIKPNNKLLIIADVETDPRVYDYLAKGAELFIPGNNIAIFILGKTQGSKYLFPKNLIALLKEADIIISPTTVSLYHAKEIRDALDSKKKMFSMTGATFETLYKYGAKADFVSLKKTASALKDLLTKSERITIFSEKGTHLNAVIKGRQGNMETSLGIFGKSSTFPDIEVNTSIIEASGEGKIVIDGAVVGYGIVKTPVELIVEKGKVTAINGGEDARQIKKMLENVSDKNIYQIAEIGIGLNPFSQIYGVIIEDEAVYGTAHFGLGNNKFMGGLNKAKTHLDFVLRAPRIFLDGNELILGKDKITYKGKVVGKMYR